MKVYGACCFLLLWLGCSAQGVQRPVCPDMRCLVSCDNGYKLDDSGCMTCMCAPSTAVEPTLSGGLMAASASCSRMMCLVPCVNGYQTDAEGCPTCVCAAEVKSSQPQAAKGPKKTTSTSEVKPSKAASNKFSWLSFLHALGFYF